MAPPLERNVDMLAFMTLVGSPTVTAASSAATTSFTPDNTDAIPSKFLISSQMFLRQDFDGFRQSSPRSTRFATSTFYGDALDWRELQPNTAPTTGATPQASPDALPDLPVWLIHAFAGLASFVLIVAVVLFLAQFPPSFTWVTNLQRNSQGYHKVKQGDYELHERPQRGRSSAVASTPNDSKYCGEGGITGTLGKRKPRHLRVNTAAEYRGLGIAVPGEENEVTESQKKRRSYDGEVLRQRPKSPAMAKWGALTGPLPSATAFSDDPRTLHPSLTPQYGQHVQTTDIESGRYQARALLNMPTPDIFDSTSPYHYDGNEAPGSAFLRKVNGGIHYAADKLAKTLHDQVTGPEDGLLLPVSNTQREKVGTPGVFVG